MIEKIKENWFVVLVAAILISSIGYYAYDTNKGKLPGKKENGKDVVTTIGDTNYYADDFFEELYGDMSSGTSTGTSVLFSLFERAVVDQSVKLTDDMKLNIANAVTQTKQNYSGQESTLLSYLQAAGYSSLDDLEAYFTHYFKLMELMANAYDEDIENLFKPIYEQEAPRVVSHILVKVEDTDKFVLTDEEKQLMDDIDKALADGKDFAEVAKEYSDDGSASNGGYLGYVDKLNTVSYVEEFVDAALKAEKGVVTDWFKTQYGYHKILVTENDFDALLADESIRETIYASIESFYPTLNSEIIWKTAQDMNVKFGNEDIEKAIKEYLGIKEEASE
ncbi:MAG: peptidylprolyl isomerase [Traorella sp.]